MRVNPKSLFGAFIYFEACNLLKNPTLKYDVNDAAMSRIYHVIHTNILISVQRNLKFELHKMLIAWTLIGMKKKIQV